MPPLSKRSPVGGAPLPDCHRPRTAASARGGRGARPGARAPRRSPPGARRARRPLRSPVADCLDLVDQCEIHQATGRSRGRQPAPDHLPQDSEAGTYALGSRFSAEARCCRETATVAGQSRRSNRARSVITAGGSADEARREPTTTRTSVPIERKRISSGCVTSCPSRSVPGAETAAQPGRARGSARLEGLAPRAASGAPRLGSHRAVSRQQPVAALGRFRAPDRRP